MNSKREQATILRDRGYSYNMIKEELGVSVSTMSYWFSDRPFTPSVEMLNRIKRGSSKYGLRRHNERVKDTEKTIIQAQRDIGVLTKRDVWMLGLGIYIGEGSKSIESVRIVNSDPSVIRFSMRWFREVCMLDDTNLILSVNIYPDSDEAACKTYWSQITNLPLANFRKTQIDKRLSKSSHLKHKLPYGTLQIRVRSNGDTQKGVVLFRKIRGWTKGALDQV